MVYLISMRPVTRQGVPAVGSRHQTRSRTTNRQLRQARFRVGSEDSSQAADCITAFEQMGRSSEDRH